MESDRKWLVRMGTLAGLLLACFALAPRLANERQNSQPAVEADLLVLDGPIRESALTDKVLPQALSIKTEKAVRSAGDKNRPRSRSRTRGWPKAARQKQLLPP